MISFREGYVKGRNWICTDHLDNISLILTKCQTTSHHRYIAFYKNLSVSPLYINIYAVYKFSHGTTRQTRDPLTFLYAYFSLKRKKKILTFQIKNENWKNCFKVKTIVFLFEKSFFFFFVNLLGHFLFWFQQK